MKNFLGDYFCNNPESEKTESEKYEFFDDEKERSELFEYSKKIAEYLKSENIPNLVIIDRSSRPLYVGVKEYLQSKYPDDKKPDIYFMNPKGFKAKENMTQEEIDGVIMDCAFKGDSWESSDQVRSKEEILKEVEDTYKKLMLDKEKPLLVFDTCIHSGKSLEPVKKALEEIGFSDLRIGAVNPADEHAKVKTDFYITKERPGKGCYPFDRDKIIEKTFDHVYSKKTDDPHKQEKSSRLRKEIRKIIGEFLKK
jgi:hypothetical protein